MASENVSSLSKSKSIEEMTEFWDTHSLADYEEEIYENEQHPLYELLDTLGAVIHAYEEKYHPMPECNSVEILRFLMEEHQLEPADLPELGTPDIASEILNGERELTVKHLQALATKFHVSPAVFV